MAATPQRTASSSLDERFRPPSSSKAFRGRQARKDDPYAADEDEPVSVKVSVRRLDRALLLLDRLRECFPSGDLPTVKVQLRDPTGRVVAESPANKVSAVKGVATFDFPPLIGSFVAADGSDAFSVAVVAGPESTVLTARHMGRAQLLEMWTDARADQDAPTGDNNAYACTLLAPCDVEMAKAFSEGRDGAAGGGGVSFLSPSRPAAGAGAAADAAAADGSRPGTAVLLDAPQPSGRGGAGGAAAVSAASLDPARCVELSLDLDVRFRAPGVVRLLPAAVEGLLPADLTRRGQRVRVQVRAAGSSRTSLPAATPLPAASWPPQAAPPTASDGLAFWLEPQHYRADAALAVLDEAGEVLATAAAPLTDFAFRAGEAVTVVVPLTLTAAGVASAGGGGAGGEGPRLRLSCTFHPAGALRLWLLGARDLPGARLLDQDCFATARLPSAFAPRDFTTPVDPGAGTRPVWNASYTTRVVDHAVVRVDVSSRDLAVGDELLGTVEVELANVYAEGQREAWAPLAPARPPSAAGAATAPGGAAAGSVHIRAVFIPPSEFFFPGAASKIGFPQLAAGHAPVARRRGSSTGSGGGGDAAGGSLALALAAAAGPGGSKEASRRESAAGSTAGSKKSGADDDSNSDNGDDFTDAEIEQAFDFLDMDKNRAVGFMELKHLLACMGELVTDAEVDMMIRMCDTEGRGLLSFFDVWAVAKHPNPGAPKFNARRLGNKLRMQLKEGKTSVSASRAEGGITAEPAAGGGSEASTGGGGLLQLYKAQPAVKVEAKTAAGLQDMAERQERMAGVKRRKQAACLAFVSRYAIRLPQLKMVLNRAESLAAYRRQHGFINYREFCSLFEVASDAPEAREMFDAYVREGEEGSDAAGRINFREVALAMCGFSANTPMQRTRFVFDLFDEDGSGTLSTPELVEIIKANHFSADDETAKRKLAVVLRESTRTGSVADVDLTIEDFMGMVKRFPNVIYPTVRLAPGMETALPEGEAGAGAGCSRSSSMGAGALVPAGGAAAAGGAGAARGSMGGGPPAGPRPTSSFVPGSPASPASPAGAAGAASAGGSLDMPSVPRRPVPAPPAGPPPGAARKPGSGLLPALFGGPSGKIAPSP